MHVCPCKCELFKLWHEIKQTVTLISVKTPFAFRTPLILCEVQKLLETVIREFIDMTVS